MVKQKNNIKTRFIDVQGVIPKLEVAIKSGMNIMLRGATGTGKTFLLSELAKAYDKKLLVLNMTSGTGIEEVKGRYIVQPNEEGETTVQWIDGSLVTAMKKGWWIVIEEANFMPEELASVFYSVMDDRRNLVLDEHENEIIEAHPNFRIFLTANWGYKGTVIPNDAIRNRIDVYFDLKYLPEKKEKKLLVRETGVKPEIANIISKFAWRQRRIKSRHTPDISTRTLIRWATLIEEGLTPVEAGEHTLVSLMYYDEKEKEKVREAMKFEFESITDKEKLKKSEKSSGKSKSGIIEKGDLVSIKKASKTFYGVVNKITGSKKGDKVWCFWNEDKDKAKDKIPSDILPAESSDYAERVELVEKGVE